MTTTLFEVGGEVPRDLSHPESGRVRRDAERMDDATLDDEEHVVAPGQHRIDTEGVGRQDALRLRAKELRPRRTIASWCLTTTMTAKHGRDARLRNSGAELLQFTDDMNTNQVGDAADDTIEEREEHDRGTLSATFQQVKSRAGYKDEGLNPAYR
ncbi:MAG: hypothetical protein ACYCTE_13170 [Acidimicrobiales bacterium]